MFENTIQSPIKLLNKITLNHKEFIKNKEHINTKNTHIKVGNKYYYVKQDVLMNFIKSERYTKYRIYILKNIETKTRYIKLVWISE